MPVNYPREPNVLTATIIKETKKNVSRALHLYSGGGLEETDEMLLGSALHCLLLQPELFEESFVVLESNLRRGKEYESLKLEKDKRIIKRNSLDLVKDMLAALMEQLNENPEMAPALEVIKNGIKEERIPYKEDGVKYAITPDAYNSDYLLDFKTTGLEQLNEEVWLNEMALYGYRVQLGLYYRILKKLGREPKKGAIHLVQSKVAPYAVFCFFFLPNFLEESAKDVGLDIADALKILASSKTAVYFLSLEALSKLRIQESRPTFSGGFF